jgi:hypothetical protein
MKRWLRDTNITEVVRVSDDYYDTHKLVEKEDGNNNINNNRREVHFHDWAFPDGDSPPVDVLKKWFCFSFLNMYGLYI